MTLRFNIEYRTRWGEEVRVLGSAAKLAALFPSSVLVTYGQSGTACHASCTLQTIRRKFTA